MEPRHGGYVCRGQQAAPIKIHQLHQTVLNIQQSRLEFVANLIVERIIEDQTTGNGLLLEIGGIDRGNA